MGVIGTREAYFRALRATLPPGVLYEEAPRLDDLLRALAGILAAAHRRVEDGLTEAFPDTAEATLADWERAAGLPDPQMPPTPSVIERRAALLDRWTGLGGQTIAHLQAIAARYGYETSLSYATPWQVGRSSVADALYGEGMAWTLIVSSPETTITSEWTIGRSSVADPLRSWGNDILEYIIRRAKPAHVSVAFPYG